MPTIIMMFGCGVSGDVEATGKSHRGLSNMSSGVYLKFQNTFALSQKFTRVSKFQPECQKKHPECLWFPSKYPTVHTECLKFHPECR